MFRKAAAFISMKPKIRHWNSELQTVFNSLQHWGYLDENSSWLCELGLQGNQRAVGGELVLEQPWVQNIPPINNKKWHALVTNPCIFFFLFFAFLIRIIQGKKKKRPLAWCVFSQWINKAFHLCQKKEKKKRESDMHTTIVTGEDRKSARHRFYMFFSVIFPGPIYHLFAWSHGDNPIKKFQLKKTWTLWIIYRFRPRSQEDFFNPLLNFAGVTRKAFNQIFFCILLDDNNNPKKFLCIWV